MSDADRIVELEVRVAFQEKWIAELDEVVRSLRDQIDGLREDLATLTASLESQRGEVVDEKPPHW